MRTFLLAALLMSACGAEPIVTVDQALRVEKERDKPSEKSEKSEAVEPGSPPPAPPPDPCPLPSPQGCRTDSDCEPGAVCAATTLPAPSECLCSENGWLCTRDSTGRACTR